MLRVIQLLERLCGIYGASGDETAVRDFIINEIKDFCEWRVDALGNILVHKKGELRAERTVMLDAHTDEVGFIITQVQKDGFLRFKTVGGIDTAALMCRRVMINGTVPGVIGCKPVHLCGKEELKKLPEPDSLYIDIGAADGDAARQIVNPGDFGVMCSDFLQNGSKIISRALDDRVGCAVLIRLIKEPSHYDFCASFSVQEEVGLRGARTAAFALNPDIAVVLEGTTAADVAGVPEDRTVCALGKGAVISFMDGASLYDRALFEAAKKSGIKHQIKRTATGGNDAGTIHLSRSGVRTAAISVPCRYIHTAGSVADSEDIESVYLLAKYMCEKAAAGEV